MLTLLFLLQWTLAGAGLVCGMNASRATHAAMAGMSSHSRTASAARDDGAACATPSSEQRCDESGGMSAGPCAMAAGCAMSVAMTPVLAPDASVMTASAVPASAADVLVSWHARPELPPPRA